MIVPDLYSFSFITPEFVAQKVNLTWTEIYWAYQHRLFGAFMFVKIAQLRQNLSDLTYELSKIDKDHLWKAEEIVVELMKTESNIPEDIIMRKWLFVILFYIYENREQFSDPLSLVEDVYEIFGCPRELDSFVRYMPVDLNTYNPSMYTYEENIERLYVNWSKYLQAEQQIFLISKNSE